MADSCTHPSIQKGSPMTDIIDLHTHPVASMHAYSTIREMAAAAKEKGLALLGISDHAPAMPGTFHEIYFHNS